MIPFHKPVVLVEMQYILIAGLTNSMLNPLKQEVQPTKLKQLDWPLTIWQAPKLQELLSQGFFRHLVQQLATMRMEMPRSH